MQEHDIIRVTDEPEFPLVNALSPFEGESIVFDLMFHSVQGNICQ